MLLFITKTVILTQYMYNAWLFMQLFQPFGFLMDIATFHACKCIPFCVVIAAYAVCMWTDVLSLTMQGWGNHLGYSWPIWLDSYIWTSDYSFMHNGSCLYCMIPNEVISHWRTWLTNKLVLSPVLTHCHQFPDPIANNHIAVMRL